MYRNNKLSSETGGCLLLIFAAVIVLVSGYSSVTNAVSYFKNRSAWKKTEAVCTEKATGSVIDDSEAYIKIHPMFNITNHQYYCADIQYTVNGETYNGSSGWSQLHDLRSGDRVTMMYDPKDPNWSYCADYPSVKMEAEINLRRALASAAWIGVVLVLFAVYAFFRKHSGMSPRIKNLLILIPFTLLGIYFAANNIVKLKKAENIADTLYPSCTAEAVGTVDISEEKWSTSRSGGHSTRINSFTRETLVFRASDGKEYTYTTDWHGSHKSDKTKISQTIKYDPSDPTKAYSADFCYDSENMNKLHQNVRRSFLYLLTIPIIFFLGGRRRTK